MNKKGYQITTHVIIGIIFSLLMLGALAKCTTNIFGISDQATKNFIEFAKEIQSFQNKDVFEHDQFILKMDQRTAIVFFEPNKATVNVHVDAKIQGDYKVTIINPEKCALDSNCLCLFRDPKFTTEALYHYIARDESAICHEVDTKLVLNQCGFGKAHQVNSYRCENGFIIERKFMTGATSIGNKRDVVYYDIGRRFVIELQRENDRIRLKG